MLKDDILRIVNKAAEDTGYSVYEASVYLKGVNSRVTVKLDSEKPIAHTDCETYSKTLGFLLDESGILPDYSLEVSSPGLNRKIRSINEFVRFRKAPVKVVYTTTDGQRVAKGILSGVDDKSIEVTEEKIKTVIRHEDIVNANLDY